MALFYEQRITQHPLELIGGSSLELHEMKKAFMDRRDRREELTRVGHFQARSLPYGGLTVGGYEAFTSLVLTREFQTG